MKTEAVIGGVIAASLSLIWLAPIFAIIVGIIFGVLVWLATLEIDGDE